MQTAPRIVVIDDKPDHLTAIVETFNSMGTACSAICYDAATGVPPGRLRGVRALFLDLHLLDGAPTSANEKHFGTLAEILQNGIDPDGGPYVLVLWTENPEKFDNFRQFLEERLFNGAPHTRPLSFVALNKTDFISPTTGKPQTGEKLVQAVKDVTEGNPQLNALLAWERDVMAAAGSTLSAILNLVPPEARTAEAGSDPLNAILSLLAREQVGQVNVNNDVRSAITTVLAPILADRIMNRSPAEGAEELWKAAVTRHQEKGLEPSPDQAAAINRMLHLSSGTTEQLLSTDWGAVVDFPKDELTEEGFKHRFGVGLGQMLGGEFLIEKKFRDAVSPVLVRVGAACDHAQNSTGPLPFLFGLIRPAGAERKKRDDGTEFPLKASVWISPLLSDDETGVPFVIEVNARFPFVMNRDDAAALKVRFRLREQLLVHLLNHAGSYQVRPGIVRLLPS